MRDNLFNTTSIVQYAENKNFKHIELIAQKQNKMSEKEFIHYLTHEVNNNKDEKGRINFGIEKDGTLFANSVSPYSKKFNENIEDGILELILALKNKRYLTYSSCESHGLTFRRYVGLAFVDIESREYVINMIKLLKIKGLEFKLYDSVANQKIEIKNKNFKFNEKITNKDKNNDYKEKEVIAFNIQFHKNYEQYYFLEVEIAPEIKFFNKNIIKNIYNLIFNRLFMEKNTLKITEYIKSNEFKRYQY